MTRQPRLAIGVAVSIGLIAVIFIVDLLTPLDLSAWLFYAAPLLLISALVPRRVTFGLAALCSVLICADAWLAPLGIADSHNVAEHLAGIGVLWLMVVLLSQRQEARNKLARQNALLETRVQERTADLEAERTRLADAAAALAASEARYQAVGELIPYGFWACDPDGNVVFLSDSFLRLVGKSLTECQQSGWMDCLRPEDQERTRADWQACREAGRPWDCTYHIPAGNGQEHHVLSRGMPMCDAAGRTVAWVGINLDVTEHVRAEQELQHMQAQSRMFARRLVEDVERERQTIARELHDEAGQALTAILIGLGLLERDCRQSAVHLVEPIQELKCTTDEVMVNLHRLSRSLRPASLDRLGLVAALRQHIQTFEQQQHIEVGYHPTNFDNGYAHLPGEIETTVYRVVQEALTNVARHAHAQHVDVVLKRKAQRVVAIVEDNGHGFDLSEALNSGRLGLVGMRERAELMGGRLDIESAPGQGTTVFMELPLDTQLHDDEGDDES